VEQRELAESPEVEQAELVQLYVARGVEVGLAREVARQLSQDPQQALVAHAREDLGVDPSDLPSPLLAAATSYLLGATTVLPTVLVSAAGMFVAGAVVSRVTARPWRWTGSRQLLLGGTAAALTYGVGAVVGTAIG
jgi:vacuolar iron transporter family protein